MAIGTGSQTLQSIPADPYVIDPMAFNQMTTKNVSTPRLFSAPGGGLFANVQLPQTGIIPKLRIVFSGTLTVATAAATSSNRWPYGLLDSLNIAANGQNNLWSCDGLDLHALRFCRFPAYTEAVDTFAGTVGGGDSIGTGSTQLYLTWEVPIAMDETSLVAALFAQSGATNLSVKLNQAAASTLFSANPGNATITGTFSIQVTHFEIPYDAQGRLVIPDLTRLHGFNAVDTPYTSTGTVRTELIRSAGQLHRLFISGQSAANTRLSALPSAADSRTIDSLALAYASNQRPMVWDTAALLLSENNDYYGRVLPYDRLCIDNVRENAPRDVILLQGVTELAIEAVINAAVTVSAGSIRTVQETLF